MAEQWPSVGRVVHVQFRERTECIPAIVTDVVGDQPASVIDVQMFPVNHWPTEYRVGVADNPAQWHWPEYVGPEREAK